MTTHPPSDILVKYLTDTGLLTDPAIGGDWPVFISRLPDGANAPNNCVAIFEQEGRKSTRLMRCGEYNEKPAIQVMLRCSNRADGWKKAGDIARKMWKCSYEKLVYGEIVYTIINFSQSTPTLYLGQEEGSKRRHLFSINAFLTITEDNVSI